MKSVQSDPLIPRDFEIIAAMHVNPSTTALNPSRNGRYRFFLDKIRLFHAFDPDSILVTRDEEGQITGVLIYTYDEPTFNRFSGPRKGRFYLRLLKTAIGYYGCDFKKFFLAAKSMLGMGVEVREDLASPSFGKIWVLLVMEEHRRKGIAGQLIDDCIQMMRKQNRTRVRVTVKTDNEPAIKAYEKCGFATIGTCEESSGYSYVMEMNLETK